MALIGKRIVLENLNKAIEKIKGANLQGLLAGATIIKAESELRTPVDTGNLRASHYISQGTIGGSQVAEVGLTVSYSVFVHEILENFHPVGEAKFLQNAILYKHGEVLEAIQKRITL